LQITELATVAIHSPETTNTNIPSVRKDSSVRQYSPPRAAKTSDLKTATQTGPVYGRGEAGGKYFFLININFFHFQFKTEKYFYNIFINQKTKKKNRTSYS